MVESGAAMTGVIASVLCGSDDDPDMAGHRIDIKVFNHLNQYSPCQAYQMILDSAMADILVYVHDDVAIHDPKWLESVMITFENPQCVAVGLGGATSLGRPDLYRKPYNIWNMARGGYASNQEDAETHGERFTGVRRVAVLDAFFMAVRREFLVSVGGWPVSHLTHHCLDLWLACEAHRAGKEIWMTGIKCNHYGGKSSTSPAYSNARWLQGGSLEADHEIPHRWLFDNYRDVLPLEVK